MGHWVRVARVDELPPGSHRVVDMEGAPVAVFSLADGFYAIDDVCTHDGGDLASGELDGDEIVCPRHGARFNVRTGEATAAPAYEPVDILPTRVADAWVEARDERE